jgi:hypothetical protein
LGYGSTKNTTSWRDTNEKELGLVNRYARIELYSASASVILAGLAGLYLVITTFAQNETCYGINGAKIECHPISGANAAETAGRLVTVLSMVLVLYALAALAARWQGRTRHEDARVTAYMALVTCSVTVLAMTLAAFEGVGFFFLPSTFLTAVASVSGLIALLQAPKDAADVGSSSR